MFGHRADGKKIKNLPPIFKVMPCVMPERVDSQVYGETKNTGSLYLR